MSECEAPLNFDAAVFREACEDSDSIFALLRRLAAQFPELPWIITMSRGGWHRSGGVVDQARQHIADSLRHWAEDEQQGNLADLLNHCLATPLFATRLMGKTHYLTAPTGPGPADFVQLEVEELQEALERSLSDPQWLPDSLEEFIDPLEYPPMEYEAIGPVRYVFRRLFHIPELLQGLPQRDRQNLQRFMHDWQHSNAADSGHISRHWVLMVRDEGGHLSSARPIAAQYHQDPPPELLTLRGADLANWIQQFDRDAGYSMAWYFHMLASNKVPQALATHVAEDHRGGFSYLPERDLAVLEEWLRGPYRA